MSPGDQGKRPWRWDLLLALEVGVVLMAIAAAQDLPYLKRAVLGFDNVDHRGAMYLHDQFHQAILAGKWPFFDDRQLAPVGISMAPVNGYNCLEMIVSGFFRLFLPWPLWFNVAHLAWIPINLACFLPLGRHLWKNRGAALAAGSAWVMAPYYFGEIAPGRLTQVALAGLPLAVLGLLRLAEEDRKFDRVLAGVGLALTALGYWFYGYFLALLLPLFLLLRKRPLVEMVRDYAIAGGIAIALTSPFLLAIAWPLFSGSDIAVPPLPRGAIAFDSALKIGGQMQAQFKAWFPFILLPGVLLTLWKGDRRVFWTATALVCVFFALGPGTRVDGQLYRLPYAFLNDHLPYLSRMMYPGRWLGLGMFFLAILAADGIARWSPRLVWILPVGVVVQLFLKGNLPMAMWGTRIPTLWQQVAEEAEGAIILLPIAHAGEAAGWGLFHHQPTLGGMVDSLPWVWPKEWRDYVQANALLMELYALGLGQTRPPSAHQDNLDTLRADGFRHVVWDWESARARQRPGERPVDNVLAILEQGLGKPRYVGDDGGFWDLPEHGHPGPGKPPPGLELPEP